MKAMLMSHDGMKLLAGKVCDVDLKLLSAQTNVENYFGFTSESFRPKGLLAHIGNSTG
jgi:hypothetical protein